jgi:hypothetical protein
MAQSPRRDGSRDPLHRLALNPLCDEPDVDKLTVEQQLALHEFFHTVLAAGYKLYQIVPARLAARVIRKKFGLMIASD